jgi:trimeric autotransporter adhesin
VPSLPGLIAPDGTVWLPGRWPPLDGDTPPAAVARQPPTFPDAQDLAEGSGTRSFTAVATNANDWLVVEYECEQSGATSAATPSGGGLTYNVPSGGDTGQVGANDGRVIYWTAQDTAGHASLTVQIAPAGSLLYRARLTVVRGSDGVGNSAATTGGTNAQTVSLGRQQDDSAVFMAVVDWSAGSITGLTWTPGGSTTASQIGTGATYMFGRWDDSGAAGTATTGLSSPAHTTPSIVVLEMLGTTATGGPATRTAADTAAATDTATRLVGLARTAADTAAATDAAPRTASFARTVADTAAATDAAVGVGGGNNRTASDTASATDTATRTLGLAGRTASDTAAATDAASRAAPKTRTTADTASATDAATRTWTAARTTADTAAASDTATRAATKTRTAADTAAATDTASRTAPRARTAADTASASDTTAGSSAGNLQRTAADTAAATDAATRSAITRARAAADAATASDTATRTAPHARVATDTAAATDAAVGAVNQSFTRTAADAATTTDVAAGSVSSFTVGQLTATMAAAATMTAAVAPTSTLGASISRGGPS